jgi:hypothetical protein
VSFEDQRDEKGDDKGQAAGQCRVNTCKDAAAQCFDSLSIVRCICSHQ